MNLIRNALQTPDGTILESTHRHDYKTYTDANGKEYMVDGGLSYLRRSIHEDQKDISLYDNEPHEVQASVLKWGTYGINGDQPLSFISISDMDIDHIVNVLGMGNISPAHKKCMENELKNRR